MSKMADREIEMEKTHEQLKTECQRRPLTEEEQHVLRVAHAVDRSRKDGLHGDAEEKENELDALMRHYGIDAASIIG